MNHDPGPPATLEFNLGTLAGGDGRITFTMRVGASGAIDFTGYSYDASDRRKSGVYFTFNSDSIVDLWRILKDIKKVVSQASEKSTYGTGWLTAVSRITLEPAPPVETPPPILAVEAEVLTAETSDVAGPKADQPAVAFFATAFQVMACIAFANRQCTVSEATAITRVMSELSPGWTSDDTADRLRKFAVEFKRIGRKDYVRDLAAQLGTITNAVERFAIKQCIVKIGRADGDVSDEEREIANRLLSVW